MEGMRQYIIGVNGVQASCHDSAAALVVVDDNKVASVLMCSEEERYIRKKRAIDAFPSHAVDSCLSLVNDGSRISDVAWGWKTTKKRSAEEILGVSPDNDQYHNIRTAPIPHHKAHAASVFYMSTFKEAAILVVDGQGETESATIWSGSRHNGLKEVYKVGIERSLGFMYASIAEFCGFGSYGSGKLMGLAPYGVPRYKDNLKRILLNIKVGQTPFGAYELYRDAFFFELKKQNITAAGCRDTSELPDKLHCDLAASAQALLMDEMLKLSRLAKCLTNSQNLCLTGGVAMNCVANSYIYNQGLFANVFLQPGCEDNGVSLGAALAVARPNRVNSCLPYLGEAFTNKQIECELKKHQNLRFALCSNPCETAAQLLAESKIIGWFQGRSEFGPRALGNRSILASPIDTRTRDRVNNIKNREQWRPFGPSVMLERCDDVFDKFHESPYMLFSFCVKRKWQQKLGAVVHVDLSTRPQSVKRDDNPRYYDLIAEFEKQTGVPAVLNTSFNGRDEPIVNSPKDAICCFDALGLDALVIGDYAVFSNLKKSNTNSTISA